MKEYTTEFIRNIALVSHGGAGKTMLAEAFLHVTGATTRLGKVEDGTSASDYDDEEHRRKISIYTSVIPVEHKNYKLNFLDAPGYTDFVGEMISALSVADGAIILVDAVAGIEVGTELAWRYCDQFNLPRFIVINKMDRENADFEKIYAQVEEFIKLHDKRAIKVHLPIGQKHDFKGVVDIIGMKSYLGDGKTTGDIPAELKEEAEKAHFTMVEAAAEGEDELMEKYLENGSLSDEEMVRGLEDVVYAGQFVPIFCAAGGHEVGTIALLNDIIDLMPSPINAVKRTAQGKGGTEELKPSNESPLAAYVWKTTADPFVGKMTYFRVFSGSLQADAHVWNQPKGADEGRMTLPLTRPFCRAWVTSILMWQSIVPRQNSRWVS
ncbi:MAG: GTP-binding protein [Anaerolineales bacterium]|nr:GTP-binding protein [Anaerolineales bacterium]